GNGGGDLRAVFHGAAGRHRARALYLERARRAQRRNAPLSSARGRRQHVPPHFCRSQSLDRGRKPMRPTALIVDDEPDICELLAITLERMDIAARTCGNVTEAKAELAERAYDLCLTDMR